MGLGIGFGTDWGSIKLGPESGGGVNPDLFIIQVQTDNTGTSADNQFTLPWVGTYDVDWGDGNTDTGVTNTQTHTYASAGTYDIGVTATSGQISFNNGGDKLKLLDIKQWGTCQWTSFQSAFRGCLNTIATFIDSPDLSNCTNLSLMFYDCQSIEMDIDNWDVSNITNINNMFVNCRLFNSPLNSWDLSSIGSSLSSIFQGCYAFNQPIGNWGNYFVGKNISLYRVFRDCRSFNQDLTNWNQANQFVGSFYEAFYFCQAFEGIGLETWNVRPSSMYYAFGFCYNFNADISGWDMSNVSVMERTFVRASSFNQPIGSWDMSNVTLLGFMFERASSFNQDISSWSVNQVTNFSNNFMFNVTLSTANYDALLIDWDAQGTMSFSGTVNFGNSQYTPGGAAEAARTSLIAKWGGIIDGGAVPQPFIIQVKTDNAGTSNNDQFSLVFSNASSPTVNYDVDWGDGNVETGITSYTKTHTYANAGVYTVSLTGQSGAFVNGNDLPKITDILQWGTYQWNLAFNFRNATNLSIWSATDSPNLSNATSMATAFVSVPLTTHDFSDWDVTTINSFANTFFNCDSFVGNGLDTWDCRNATNLSLLTSATGITTANYDALLIAWDSLGSYTFSGTANFGGSRYTLGGAAEAARTSLISKWGGIVDGGGVLDATTNLVASYNFDSDLSDYNGNYDGTTSGTITHSAFKVNNGADFSGATNDYVTLPNTNDAFTFHDGTGNDIPFSVSFWVDIDDGSNNSDTFFWIGNDVNNRQISISRNALATVFRVYTNTNNRIDYQIYRGAGQTPVHYCFTYDGTKTTAGLKGYLNGVYTIQSVTEYGTYTGINPLSNQNTVIGSIANTGGYELEGLMDEFHIWKDRVLTADEVLEIYNTENGGTSILP